MAASSYDIGINLVNTTTATQTVNLLTSPYDLQTNLNNTVEHRFDVTSFTFTNEDSVTIFYRAANQTEFQSFTSFLDGNTYQSIADALNTLGIGFFYVYTDSGNTYVATYNNAYYFENLNIFSSSIIDSTFLYGTGFNSNVNVVYSLPNNAVLAGGAFTDYNGFTTPRIAKTTQYGTYVSIVASSGFNGAVNAIVVQSDGKILVGGAFTLYEGIGAARIIRLNEDGTIDNTFVYGTGFNVGQVNTIAIQPDGQILVGGSFTSYDGNSCGRIVRLNTDGSIDGSFPVPVGFNNTVNVIKVLDNEYAYVGGYFTTYFDFQLNNVSRIVKIALADATVDTSFNTGTGFDNPPFAIAIQSNGQIIVGGDFNTYNSINAYFYIIRLNTDGSPDDNFNYTFGFDSSVYAIEIENATGKIICGGDFASFNGTPCNRILRLNYNATVDTSWDYGLGFDAIVSSLSMNSSQSAVVVGGQFTSFNGTPANRIIRLLL